MVAFPSVRCGEAGLTLVELMVVVVIVGILSVAAVVTISRGPRLDMVAMNLAGAVAEVSRKAVAEGALDPAVTTNEGFSARARLFVGYANDKQFYSIEVRRADTATTSAWEPVAVAYLPAGIRIAGAITGVAHTQPGATPIDLPEDGFEVLCEPSGSCGAATIFMEKSDSSERDKVVVMPLASAPLVLDGW